MPSCLLLLSGCNIFGWAAQSVAGTETTNASFVLPKKSTVVIVENFANPADAVYDDEPIARFITDDLRQHNVVPLIDTDVVYAFRTGHPDQWHASTIAGVGRAVGAEQIIYVNLVHTGVEVAAGSDMMRGQGTALVRVVDANTGATLWPIGQSDGASVADETKMVTRGENHIFEGQTRSAMHRELSRKIGELFYQVTKESAAG